MDLPFTKIIVDSRHADAGTSESFEITLPETLSLPQQAVCYVCDLQVTNTFPPWTTTTTTSIGWKTALLQTVPS